MTDKQRQSIVRAFRKEAKRSMTLRHISCGVFGAGLSMTISGMYVTGPMIAALGVISFIISRKSTIDTKRAVKEIYAMTNTD